LSPGRGWRVAGRPGYRRKGAIESGTDSAHALRGWEVANILDDSFVSLAKDASFEAT